MGRMLQYQDANGETFGLQGVVWKPQYYCDMVREFRRVALRMTKKDPEYNQLIETVCMVLEFDDAYRYRLQDLFQEVNVKAIKENPSRELKRVFAIGMERGEGTKEKFESFSKLISVLCMVKSVRNGIIEFFSKIKIKKMVLDDADFYRCMFWGGYKFRGIPDEERASVRIMIDAQWKKEQEEELKKQKEEAKLIKKPRNKKGQKKKIK